MVGVVLLGGVKEADIHTASTTCAPPLVTQDADCCSPPGRVEHLPHGIFPSSQTTLSIAESKRLHLDLRSFSLNSFLSSLCPCFCTYVPFKGSPNVTHYLGLKGPDPMPPHPSHVPSQIQEVNPSPQDLHLLATLWHSWHLQSVFSHAHETFLPPKL